MSRDFKFRIVSFLLLMIMTSVNALDCAADHDDVPFGEEEQLDWELEEFRVFCKNLAHQRRDSDTPASEMPIEALCDEEVFDPANLRMLFVLMLMFAYGAFIRTILKILKINLPYTVLLMMSGLLIGSLSTKFCDTLSSYTAIARIPPKIILFTFLPVLIFESAFSITPHTFLRMLAQILIVALPGMVMATFMTAVVVEQFLYKYNWTFLESSLFGSIISATDPVAVVAILRELGTSEMLGTMVEGESLLNDGIAILLYEILEKIITCEVKENLGVFILKKFGQITLGGPVFGFFMGKVAVFCLSLIFNDSTVEITITLVSAYLTYYIGEDILGVSGVMAVVVLGITMGSERTSISPEVENFVHHFWEMLGYFANTVLFMIVGIVITETAINNLELKDWVFLIFLYIMLNIVRLVMLLILYPLVSRIGYGLTWQNMIVMMWGGLRGAVSICLALDVYDNKHLCQTNLGPKFLFQTAGIVFLTLVVNGTTTKMLLDVLKLTEISSGRIQDMGNAMKQLELAQYRTINMLKHDRFVADANWSFVDKYTTITNPYAKAKVAERDLPASQSLVSLKGHAEDHQTECPECHNLVMNEPTTAEYMEMTEEARLRILKALKVSFWRQFEQGVLIELAVLQLVAIASATEDKPLRLVHAHDLRKYWTIRGCLPWMKTKFIKTFGLEEEMLPPKPNNKFRRALWWLATRDWFDYVIILIILVNMIPAIWDTVLLARDGPQTADTPESKRREKAFFYSSVAFNIIYLLEMLIKVIGRGPRDYFWVNKFNYIDVVVLLLGFVDMILYLNDVKFSSAFVFVKIFRVVRAVRLLRPLVPRFMRFVDGRINRKLFLGYDVGKGFVTAVDDVIKYLPQMVENPKVLHKLKHVLERERLETVREMGIMSKDHPGIAIAVKTHHASRAVLNQMKDALTELKEDGLVDEKECEILTVKLEENMKKLWKAPPSIAPAPPEALLQNVNWILGNEEIYNCLHERAELISFAFGDTICRAGDTTVGVYIITSGLVKVHYIPNEEVVAKFDEEGELPNMELFVDLTFRSKEDDFFSTGTVIGEQGVLTGQRRAAAVKCETSVFAYYVPHNAMKEALKKFSEPCISLEGRMWRAVGMRLALSLLPKHPNYSTWGSDKIRLHCERSFVPTGSQFDTLVATDFIADILVITGRVKDFHSDDVYFAPQLVPRSVSKMTLIHSATAKTRLLLIANEDIEPPGEDEEGYELFKCYSQAVEFNQRNKLEDRSAADLAKRFSEQLKFGARRKQKREMSKKDGRREGFPKEVTTRKKPRGGSGGSDDGPRSSGGS